MANFQWQRETDIDDPVWPSAVVLASGGVGVAFVRQTGLHLQIFDSEGGKLGDEHFVEKSIPGAWQLRPQVAELVNGNIVAFASDIVDPNYKYDFQGRFIYSVVNPNGELIDSGDIRTKDFLGQGFRFKAADDGSLTVDFHSYWGSVTISEIGLSGVSVVSPSSYDSIKDSTWSLPNDFGNNIDIASNSTGIAFEVSKVSQDGGFMLTKQTNFADNRPYFGYFEKADRDDLKSESEFVGTTANDVFRTNANPTITNEGYIIDGGEGVDTIVINGEPIQVLTASAGIKMMKEDGIIFISGSSDRLAFGLTSVERIKIEYAGGTENEKHIGTFALDVEGNAGQVYRLYQAAFARTPDTAGLSSNIKLVDEGLTLHDLASAFAISQEFNNKYGFGTTDTVYINALYNNVLGRDADPAGLEGWQSVLSDGTQDRGGVLIGFSESGENIALTSASIQDGIWLG